MSSTEAAAAAPAAMNKENNSNQSSNDRQQRTSGVTQPWVEAYRPRTLKDVVGNQDTVERLQAIASTGNLPNLILCGPPGTGKCVRSDCLAYEVH